MRYTAPRGPSRTLDLYVHRSPSYANQQQTSCIELKINKLVHSGNYDLSRPLASGTLTQAVQLHGRVSSVLETNAPRVGSMETT